MNIICRSIIAGVVGIAAGLLVASQVKAQAVCADRGQMVSILKDQYGETRRSIGLQGGVAVVEVFVNQETGGWSVLSTDASGQSCLVLTGDNHEFFEPEVVGEDS